MHKSVLVSRQPASFLCQSNEWTGEAGRQRYDKLEIQASSLFSLPFYTFYFLFHFSHDYCPRLCWADWVRWFLSVIPDTFATCRYTNLPIQTPTFRRYASIQMHLTFKEDQMFNIMWEGASEWCWSLADSLPLLPHLDKYVKGLSKDCTDKLSQTPKQYVFLWDCYQFKNSPNIICLSPQAFFHGVTQTV